MVEDIVRDATVVFLSSTLGIIIQLSVIGGVLGGFLRFLDKRQNMKINQEVKNQLTPAIDEIKNVKLCLQSQQRETAINIKYLDKAIMHLQGMEEGREIKDYRLVGYEDSVKNWKYDKSAIH